MNMKQFYLGILRIQKRQGIINFLSGFARKRYYKSLHKRFGFGEWHITPYELRPYAVDVKNCINDLIAYEKINGAVVCEVGCGLGDILRNVQGAERKVGIDMSKQAIQCARYLDSGGVDYHAGSFKDAPKYLSGFKRIDILLTINFIHNIVPDELKEYYGLITNNIETNYIILDSVKGTGYKFCHDVHVILPSYSIEQVIGRYDSKRIVYLMKRKSM